ncbi:hypothetical protein BH10PSE6_BH10PSE6_04950 [soil metagenome]
MADAGELQQLRRVDRAGEWTVEIEGKERPACIAETMSIAYAKT